MRYLFGGNTADSAQSDPTKGDSVVTGPIGVTATAWTTRTGKTQVTDLLPSSAGDPAPVVLNRDGNPSPFQGPDGVDTLWLDFGDGSARVQLRGRGRVVLPPPPTDLPSALVLLNVLRAGLIRAGLATDA